MTALDALIETHYGRPTPVDCLAQQPGHTTVAGLRTLRRLLNGGRAADSRGVALFASRYFVCLALLIGGAEGRERLSGPGLRS